MSGLKHLSIKMHGRVQGVFFRDSAKKEAEKMGLGGFARNEPDGSVYIEAEGEEEKLKKFLEWCRQGSPSSRVEKAEESWSSEIRNFKEFEAI